MFRQIRVACRIQVVGFERDHLETIFAIEIFDEAPDGAAVVASAIDKYVPSPRNDTVVVHGTSSKDRRCYRRRSASVTFDDGRAGAAEAPRSVFLGLTSIRAP